ncbi:MAG: helix-turn-helix transcriptional regulator [Candidatus Cryptobacteroides sp.]
MYGFLLISFTAIAVLWFLFEEYPALFALYIPTYAVSDRKMAMIAGAILAASILFIPEGFMGSALIREESVASPNASVIAIAILSSLLVLALMKLAGFGGSFLYTCVAALQICYGTVGSGESHAVLLFVTMLAATVAAFAISALLSILFKYTIAGKRVHLIRLASRMRGVVIVLIILMAVATGLNWGGFLSALGKSLSGLTGRGATGIFASVLLVIYLATGHHITRMTDSASAKYYDFLLYNVLAAGISTIAVLTFFSYDRVCTAIELTAMPLPAGSILLASIAGTAAALGQHLVESDDYIREGLSSLLAPAGAMLMCHILMNFCGIDIESDDTTDIILMIASLIILSVIGAVAYLKRLREQKKAAEQLVRSQQQQIYENARALNDMEMKVVLSENQALHETLEMKRQEVMNVALSICEQKEYLESLNTIVKQIEETDDQARKEELTSELGASIRQRLSYDRDVDTSYFYAKAESLHEDFNQKLSETFPDLTPQERRLATLLRLGFSSKYIATLMNITPKSVEISRYRLRQKLGLGKGDNLVNYIKSI